MWTRESDDGGLAPANPPHGLNLLEGTWLKKEMTRFTPRFYLLAGVHTLRLISSRLNTGRRVQPCRRWANVGNLAPFGASFGKRPAHASWRWRQILPRRRTLTRHMPSL